jgi:excisionase family DNA binding protein
MNKKEAAERLNVSTRLVERYAGEGRLGEVRYVRGKTGKQADYDKSEVERLKAELETPDAPITALQAANSPTAGLVAPQERERFLHALEALSNKQNANPQPTIYDLAVKPLLTLAEAQVLTGLSRNTLRDAIDAKKLKAQIIGRAWRVKGKDLHAYIDKL